MNATNIPLYVDEKLRRRLKADGKMGGKSLEKVIETHVSTLGSGVSVAPLKPTRRSGCHLTMVTIAPGDALDALCAEAARLTVESADGDRSLTVYSKAYILDRLLDAKLPLV